MTRDLEEVCRTGTASLYFRDSTRYRVAAKTGTAQITDSRMGGRYYLGSMIAFFPSDDPRYTVLTTIETRAQPGKAYYGGPLAGPVVKRMVDYISNREQEWHGRVEQSGERHYPEHIKGGSIEQMREVAGELAPRLGPRDGRQHGARDHRDALREAQRHARRTGHGTQGCALRARVARAARRLHGRGFGPPAEHPAGGSRLAGSDGLHHAPVAAESELSRASG